MNISTESGESFLSLAMRALDEVSRDVPIDTTLTELQLIVERVSFSSLHERKIQNDAATLAQIDLFFRDEISPGMVSFVRWMANRNMLHALAGDPGRLFLNHCIKFYRQAQEVIFSTAIDLDDEYKQVLMEKLRAVHPAPTRILFRSSPNVVAGFVIEVGQTVVDKSLRTHVATMLPRGSKIRHLAGDEKEAVGVSDNG